MRRRHYALVSHITSPNIWDMVALLLILSLVFVFAALAREMNTPYQVGQALPISLSYHALPGYALKTVLRMAIALLCAFTFTFVIGALAAKNRQAERIIIPALDILQSLPVLGFLSITVVGFISLFPGSLLGPECASIFAIFTSQAWNMTFSFYQSLRTVPADLQEAGSLFRLSAWQRFWRIEVPFATPALLWNAMMSMSAGWFFVVASEAISVSNQHISLPGIGSYIDLAIKQADVTAVSYAVLTMLVIIVLYDQLFFRPLLCWSEKFKLTQESGEESYKSWVVSLLQRTRLLRYCGQGLTVMMNCFINLGGGCRAPRYHEPAAPSARVKLFNRVWNVVLLLVAAYATLQLAQFIYQAVAWQQIRYVFWLGAITGLRVVILIFLSSIIWVPVGVWIGTQPKLARIASPLIQVAAAFPANLLFPAVVILIVKFDLNPEIWTAPLMILGAQWYILFNVIAGAAALPKDLYQAAANLGVKGWLWWRRLVLPGIYPYYITGAISAAGGAWNASILAESVRWGDTHLQATGLGAYITEYTQQGDFPRIALGIGVMCAYVLLFNRLLWRPLYDLAQRRFSSLT
jgi:NitT/TauT family transport system permease protein